ncbi:MAG TPA: anion permease [Acidimicrobiia bacterium]|jgi:PiT family inorganic phosphate transporter|nr:anion permease [Acidimicrobiia bacterium]
MTDLALYAVIAIALAFDFTNGFHDAANSIATVVATRVLTPRLAVLWAATFNFIAFLIFKTAVASTIAKGVVTQEVLSIGVVFAALIGAITWNLVTYYMGLPSSSSHALVGGIVGAAVVKSGFNAVISDGLSKIAVFIVLAPLIGLAVAFICMVVVLRFAAHSQNVERLNRRFRRLQLISAGAYSLGHGGNDAQKTMGVILALLIATHKVAPTSDVPIWVVLAAHSAIALGTLSGGWRVVHTLGSRITKLQPAGGVAAESAAAATLFFVSAHGIPVSTTHTITGAIIGVGSIQRLSAVRWGVAGRVVWAWVLTIPGAAIVSALAYMVLKAF